MLEKTITVKKTEIYKKYIGLIFGSLISALSLNLFLTPNSLAPGGASGLGTVLYKSFAIPVSVTVLAVNAVLLVIGYRNLGKKTLIKTIVATLFMSMFIQLTSPLDVLSNDLILSALLGGAMMGLGTGLTIACGGSTGGTDLAAILLNRVFPAFSVAKLILLVDAVVIALSGIAFKNYEIMLYSAISLFVSTKIADNLIEGVNFALLLYVISDNGDKISEEIMNKLGHGVTSLDSTGMYSKNHHTVLLCAIRKNEFVKLRRIVKNIDEKAFIILTDARSVLGEGFNYY